LLAVIVLPQVVYRIKSTVPKPVNLRHSGRFLSSSKGDVYLRVCITSEAPGHALKYKKSGQFGTTC
jgi:hypothetical protein